MRNNNGFMTGMIAGAALGALVVLAMSPQVRRPVMEGASEMGERMRKMWNRGARSANEAVPGDLQ